MYKSTPFNNAIFRTEDSAFIPLDESNRDYQRYLKWLDGYDWQPDGTYVKTAEKNTPLPADVIGAQ